MTVIGGFRARCEFERVSLGMMEEGGSLSEIEDGMLNSQKG